MVVRAQNHAEPGEIVVALVDGESTVKRLARRNGQCGKLGETFRGSRFSACAARQGLQGAIKKAAWRDRRFPLGDC